MPRIARLVVYDGDEQWLRDQMGRSRNEGRLVLPGGSITVINVSAELLSFIHAAGERLVTARPTEVDTLPPMGAVQDGPRSL